MATHQCMQGQLQIGFWMLHRCHQAASLPDKLFVYHLSCCCCSVIIKCSFTSWDYHHSWKCEDKLKDTMRQIHFHSTLHPKHAQYYFCIGLHLIHGIEVVSKYA